MNAYFTSADAWKELLSNDFNRGYLTGVVLVLAIVLLVLLVRIVLALVFRTRRARAVVVAADDGDVLISQDAVAAAVDSLLAGFPELRLDTLKIYRKGGHRYFLVLQCRFHSTERTFPDVAAQMKSRLFQGLEKQFGICDLRKIRIVLNRWEPAAPGTAQEKTSPAADAEKNAAELPEGNTDGF